MDYLDLETIWRDVLENIKISVSPAIFQTWFSQTHLIRIEEQGERLLVSVGCNSPFVKSTIEDRYFGLIQDNLNKNLDKTCDVTFQIHQQDLKPIDATTAPLFRQDEARTAQIKVRLNNSRVRENYTFENFAVSASNQMAHAAAEAVSENPGVAYNPLFLWGGVGVGKTHLANAVAYQVFQKNPDAKMLFCTAEDFTNDIVEGIRNKTTQMFRDKYRKLDILLLDDIQFIAGKDTVQEEFFHTFNYITRAGGQVILTSDRPPSEISKLEERLRSRFEAGLIVDIAPADFELRCAILIIKTKEKGIELSMEDIKLAAANLDSARKLEGFIKSLISQARLKNTEVGEGLVSSILNKPGDTEKIGIRATPQDVIELICEYYSVGKRAILGESRARPVARPRQVLMYLLRKELGLPLEEVGRLVGGRDHTTVMHAVDKITALASENVQIREDILGIKQKI